MKKMKHSILVISEGPPPLGSTHVEGGGLRAWGLAKGMASHGFDVTFAYRSTFDLADDATKTVIPDGVSISTWNGKTISELLRLHKIIILRYAMGEAYQIISQLSDDHILVSDNYIPISVEVAARKSSHPDEQTNYLRLQQSSLRATRRADYILYASESQFDYYIGYLAGINKLNPLTYGELQSRMFRVPYGVDPTEKKVKTKKPPTNPTLLWYGAFYSWFDMESLIESLIDIKKEIPNFKLVIAGAKNPYNKDPGILAHYDKTMKALAPIKGNIELIPWGAFDERFETYAKGSAIITWNHIALENEYAWRTRLMDFVLAERPIITNGGDPLGEDLIKKGVAFRASTATLKDVFIGVLDNPPDKSLYDLAAHDYSWSVITKNLARQLKDASRMTQADMELTGEWKADLKRKSKLALKAPYIVARSIIKNGFKETIWRIATKLRIIKK